MSFYLFMSLYTYDDMLDVDKFQLNGLVALYGKPKASVIVGPFELYGAWDTNGIKSKVTRV